MELKVTRLWKKDTYCGGKLFINDKFFCFTIEDCDRGLSSSMSLEEINKLKQFGITAIPTGRYEITITFSNRFQKPMIQIMNVKGFEGVRMHVANTAKDVEGCIGVAYEDSSDGFAGDSKKCAEKLEVDVELAIKKEKIWLTIE